MSKAINNEHKIPEGYKQTAIGVIPKEWVVSTLGSVGIWKGGGTPSKSENRFWTNGTIPWISPKDMKTLFIEASEDYITHEAVRKSSTNLVPENSILVVTRSGILRSYVPVAINLIPVTINQDLKSLTVPNRNDFKYIFYYLLCFNDRLLFEAAKDGTTVESLEFGSIKSFKIPLPPLPEQQKIAAIISTWDEAIEKTQKLITQLKQRNKGLAQQLLTGKKRLKGFTGEWKKATFGDVAKRISRRNDELNDSVVTISAQRGFVLQEDFFTKRVASETLSHYYLIHKGEFAYNKSYSNGYPMGAFKRLDRFDKAVVTTLYICFSLRENVNSNFMMYFFEAGLMNKGLMKIAQEGGRAHGLLNISLSDFFGLDIYVPELSEQQAIAQVLNQADTELKLYEHKIVTFQQQKKGLMQKLLTGEIRVKLND